MITFIIGTAVGVYFKPQITLAATLAKSYIKAKVK